MTFELQVVVGERLQQVKDEISLQVSLRNELQVSDFVVVSRIETDEEVHDQVCDEEGVYHGIYEVVSHRILLSILGMVAHYVRTGCT